MKNPKTANLYTPEQVRKGGWHAEARDADGHLMTMHGPFTSDNQIARYVNECRAEGWTCTIWPPA